ncbi:LysR family transcriptional regulator [Rhodobacteraceae bacterium N5(2021)]|uniref:LysR family transcriptional regulator n=1 Tax=Gymnodinialimonas phycosphaerae TaxID=2841589 RepID=A0A975TYE7_9RHOB|nr:LysR family transcriptional regulator [Gymnodinialimonas phycosphaerae]MBY4893031.1 LysR family transcriptional regulator [Gymnodinialimonas phycosphaerae]
MRSDLRQIRYFVATAEELHFRRAAERLGIAQPALSRAIQALEAELDVALFVRTNRSVQITTAGRVFLEGAREVLALTERVVDQTRTAHDGRVGELRIGYTDFAIAGALPGLLKGFQERHPRVTLKPQHGVTLAQIGRMVEGKLDVGFVTGPINRDGFDQCVVQSEAFECVVADSHPFAKRAGIQIAELASEDFVHGSSKDWQHFYDYLLPLCRRAGFAPRIVQEAFNTAGILGLVSCGMGVTVLTERVCAALGPGLITVPLLDVDERLVTSAIWRKDHLAGPARHFVDYLRTLPPAP